MAASLKRTSELIVIGATITESAVNIFTELQVDLQLNPLDNEVFVVQALDLDLGAPDVVGVTNTKMTAAVTTTSQGSMPSLAKSTTLAHKEVQIRGGAVGFTSGSMETPPTTLDRIGLISTNDFFIQVGGTGNLAPHSVTIKMYGYRAKATAATYAALVQSEILSA